MARKTATGAGKRRDTRQAIVESALTLAAGGGWGRVGLGDIAEAAGVSLAELRAHFPSRNAIVAGFIADVDRGVLAARDPEMAGRPAPDRLFDVLMKRFDLLNPHKRAVAAILRSSPSDPAALACAPLALRRSMRWMLEAADLNGSGVRGRLRVAAMTTLYLSTIPVWLRDESADMARTMAALDRRLKRLDRLTRVLCRLTPVRNRVDDATAEAM